MKTLLIVFHTMTGGTQQMAEAAARGAAGDPTVDVRLRCAAETAAGDVLSADGYIFATPENLAAMSGMMKDFFDRTYYAVLDQINGQLERIATGWRLKAVAEPIIVCTHAQTPEEILRSKVIAGEDIRRCEDVGAALAAGLSMGIY